MAGGPILPSSMYLGGGSGIIYPKFYIPATNTNTAGAIEGIGVAASLGPSPADAPAVLQFNMPELIPSGTPKVRCLAWANASAGIAKLTIADASTSAGASIAATTLTTETQVSQNWATGPAGPDIMVENKVTLTATAPTSNQVLTILATYNATGWTLAQESVWQLSIVFE